jgi:hypothetical protein
VIRSIWWEMVRRSGRMRADECHEGDGYPNLDLRRSDICLFPDTFPGLLREACTAPKIRRRHPKSTHSESDWIIQRNRRGRIIGRSFGLLGLNFLSPFFIFILFQKKLEMELRGSRMKCFYDSTQLDYNQFISQFDGFHHSDAK